MSVEENKRGGLTIHFCAHHECLCPGYPPVPSPPFSDLCHDCGFSFIEWACAGKKKKKRKKGTSAHSRSVPRCSMRSVLEPASQIHDCMTAAPLKIRHVSCDVWLLLDKLSAGILFILLRAQPQRVKKAKLKNQCSPCSAGCLCLPLQSISH